MRRGRLEQRRQSRADWWLNAIGAGVIVYLLVLCVLGIIWI